MSDARAKSLSVKSPFPYRLRAWMKERFPLPNAVLFSALYLSAILIGRYETKPGPFAFEVEDVFGFVAAWSFFLLLRVVDEHKDYEADCRNHPDRILQRGLITLTDLRLVGLAAVILQLGWSMRVDGGFGPVSARWFILSCWTYLTAREFFVGDWLRRHVVLYALSHMLIMPLVILWLAQMGAGENQPGWLTWCLGAAAFFSGLTFELTRKSFAPEEERKAVDSYTKAIGRRRAPIVILFVAVTGLLLTVLIIRQIVPERSFVVGYTLLALSFAVSASSLIRFATSPSISGRKINEVTTGLFLLTSYGALILACLMERGIQ